MCPSVWRREAHTTDAIHVFAKPKAPNVLAATCGLDSACAGVTNRFGGFVNFVIPAEAGIQVVNTCSDWMPASAGMKGQVGPLKLRNCRPATVLPLLASYPFSETWTRNRLSWGRHTRGPGS